MAGGLASSDAESQLAEESAPAVASAVLTGPVLAHGQQLELARAVLSRAYGELQSSSRIQPLPHRVGEHQHLVEACGTEGGSQLDEGLRHGRVRGSCRFACGSPVAVFGHLDPTDGLEIELSVVMAAAQDANAAVFKATNELSLAALVAQRYGLGPLVNRVEVRADTVKRFELEK